MTAVIEVSKVLGCAIGLLIGSVAIFSAIIVAVVVISHQTFNFNGLIGTIRGYNLIEIIFLNLTSNHNRKTNMTNSQLKTVQENIFSIREIAMAMLQSSDSHMIELAEILADRVLDIEMELYNPEPEVMTKSYNSISNRIETISTSSLHPTHITSVPCYTFTFEEWREENRDAITEYIAEYPDNFTPDMTRYNMEMKLWLKGPGPTGIYNDDIIFRVESLEPEVMTNISEDDFRELLVEKEYEMLKENHPKQYELASDEEQIEKWVDAMDKQIFKLKLTNQDTT